MHIAITGQYGGCNVEAIARKLRNVSERHCQRKQTEVAGFVDFGLVLTNLVRKKGERSELVRAVLNAASAECRRRARRADDE